MREFIISNMNYADAKLVAGDFESHINDDEECPVYIHAFNNKVILAWNTLNKSEFNSIYDVVYNLFDSDSDFCSDTFDIYGFRRELENLKENHAIFIDFATGDIEVKARGW